MVSGFSEERRRAAFWAKVDRRSDGECWPWTAAKDGNGYGKFGWGYPTLVGAHRAAFFYANGYWPDHACHTCDHKWCVNPSHIYDGSKSSNQRDFYARSPLAPERREQARRLGQSPRPVRGCSVEDCDRLSRVRGMCDRHYRRVLKAERARCGLEEMG